MMRTLTILVILVSFVVTIAVYINKSAAKEEEKRKKYLENNIVFEGSIISFETSSNHAFGIIRLKLIHCNVKAFHKTLSGKKYKTIPGNIYKSLSKCYYPYQIKDSVAELYCYVSNERKIGDIVRVVSNKQTIYYNPATSKERGDLSIITSTYDMDFVKEHTIFNK